MQYLDDNRSGLPKQTSCLSDAFENFIMNPATGDAIRTIIVRSQEYALQIERLNADVENFMKIQYVTIKERELAYQQIKGGIETFRKSCDHCFDQIAKLDINNLDDAKQKVFEVLQAQLYHSQNNLMNLYNKLYD